MSPELDKWFETEILSHEAALTRYLWRVWRRRSDLSDLLQEVYVRVYESAAEELPATPRAFLFATARNLVTDRVRHERVVSIDYTQDLESLNVLVDEISPESRLSARQELRRLSDALDALPTRYREVIWLRRVEGLSQKETAGRLAMPEGTVESHLSRGMQMLRQSIFRCETRREAQDRARGEDSEDEHG